MRLSRERHHPSSGKPGPPSPKRAAGPGVPRGADVETGTVVKPDPRARDGILRRSAEIAPAGQDHRDLRPETSVRSGASDDHVDITNTNPREPYHRPRCHSRPKKTWVALRAFPSADSDPLRRGLSTGCGAQLPRSVRCRTRGRVSTHRLDRFPNRNRRRCCHISAGGSTGSA